MISLFKYLKRVKSVLITTHAHADIDAYSSVYAISNILATKGINSKVYLPNGLNEGAKRISSLLPIDSIDEFEESDAIIILDTNNPSLLGDISNKMINSKKIIIDHHPSLNKINGIEIIDTNASSTCEILSRLLKRVKLSKDVATALLLGIFTDSQNLLLANNNTIECVNRLSKLVSIEEIRKILAKERSYSERMARLKSAKRMELYKIVEKDLIIAVSKVGSYHSSAARGLIELGADLSIVISKDDNIKVSMRSSNRFSSLTDLHLGVDIASKISRDGGGHSNAAAFTIDREDAYKDIFSIIERGYKIKKISM